MKHDYIIQPWAHQKLAIERAEKLNYFGLFFEQGTGKTSTLINILRSKFQNDAEPFRTLILCPPIVIENWKRELLKYSHIPESKIVPLTKSCFFRLHATDRPKDAIYITNYQGLLMDLLFERFKKMSFTAVVCDESHKIKTYNSKTTKRVLELGALAKYRYCLSGTPFLNTVSDMFPQALFLDGGETFGKNYFRFRKEYFHDFNEHMPRNIYFPNWKMKPSAIDEIGRKIAPFSARVLKSDCLDLPPLIRQRIDCDLTDEQADTYRTLEKEFIAELGDSKIVTDLELTKGLRLQQIVSGHCPNERGEIHEFKPNKRIEAVREVLQNIASNHKTLIWAAFRENFRQLEALCTDLGIPYVSVYGGFSSTEQRRRCEQFEQDNKIRVLIGHPRSCGVGVNLTAADYSIFFSRSFSLEDDLQAEARNHRGGSEKHASIIRIDLTTTGTIDEVILNALAEKQSLSEAVLNHVKQTKENSCYPQLPNRHQVNP